MIIAVIKGEHFLRLNFTVLLNLFACLYTYIRSNTLHLPAKFPANLTRNDINGRKRSHATCYRVSPGKRSFNVH